MIEAVLTTGWPEQADSALTARELHAKATKGDREKYGEILHDQLSLHHQPQRILSLEGILRRQISGFGAIQTMVAQLLNFKTTVHCEIDAFAFAFLKGVKNYDTFMTVNQDSHQALQETLVPWQTAVKALADFERIGTPLPLGINHLKTPYLALRRIVGRQSARDERRALIVLLVTGPATEEEIQEDLRLNYALSKRVMNALVQTKILEYREKNEQYAICLNNIPVVLFLVQELMGLDFLNMLNRIEVS